MAYGMSRVNASLRLFRAALVGLAGLSPVGAHATTFQILDFTDAVVVVSSGTLAEDERFAATVLVEEVAARTGIRWRVDTATSFDVPYVRLAIPDSVDPELGDEGYRIEVDLIDTWVEGPAAIRLSANRRRGLLYAVGYLLRQTDWDEDAVLLPSDLSCVSVPDQALRGMQLGYGPMQNTYDAWDEGQYEQYIRELVLFGMNAVESSTSMRDRPGDGNDLMDMSRAEMNAYLSDICARYDIAFWLFTPATVDLSDQRERRQLLAAHEAVYRDMSRLDVVFVPGGDPGHNDPRDLMPFLRELSELVVKYHPEASVWFSMQKFEPDKAEWTFDYLNEHQPDWIGGIVAGPWDPGIDAIRRRVPSKYSIRCYPDITHNIRSQFPVPWWDPALIATIGREGPNPRPEDQSIIHRAYTRGTIGFLAYSEGIHDDVNKIVWLARGWEAGADIRAVLVEYARLFLAPGVSERAADGILAFERGWRGSLATNGGVEATLALWRRLEDGRPDLVENWRWQLGLLRAYYDAYIRNRLVYETQLEAQAYESLARASEIGANAAMVEAEAALERAVSAPVRPELAQRIRELCYELYRSIGYQTSVEEYGAHGPERGAILDFMDRPVNDRWWLEDRFADIRALDGEPERCARLDSIRSWESPGRWSVYDDVGNVAKSPHVVRGETIDTDPYMSRNPNPFAMWWEEGRTRARQSWVTDIHWPIALRYDDLDASGKYVVRMTGAGDIRPRFNGIHVEPTAYGPDREDLKEWPVPYDALADGPLVITFDDPDVGNIHWRQWSRVNEVWLIRNDGEEPR